MVLGVDDLALRVLNMTGRNVVFVDPMGGVRTRLASAGTVAWVNQSIPLARRFAGLPVYQFCMGPAGTLPPVPPTFDPVKNPQYILVDFFTAMALAALNVSRPDILVAVESSDDPITNELVVKALGHVPLP